jgi:hypothetical protein
MPTTVYSYPVSGTVAPTILQALGCNMLTAQAVFVDADATGSGGAVITHNWQLSTAQLANLWPTVQWYSSPGGTLAPVIAVALTNSIAVTVTKTSPAVGSGGTYTVILLRPMSEIT